MSKSFKYFEKIVRKAEKRGRTSDEYGPSDAHPFDERNIHPKISLVSIRLFDNGHYSQATFEALKYLDKKVQEISKTNESGFRLMMSALSEKDPKIKLTPLLTQSDIDEQIGYKHIFAGAMAAIRNPRGHDINIDPIDRCLDHLSLASVLLRRLEEHIH